MAVNRQAIGGYVDLRAVFPVVADVEQVIGHDVFLQRHRGRGEGAESRVGGNDLGFECGLGKLGGHGSLLGLI